MTGFGTLLPFTARSLNVSLGQEPTRAGVNDWFAARFA
jgi:hypothetical protein